MTRCPQCRSAVDSSSDHCPHCGAYLRWELSGRVTAVPRTQEKEAAAGSRDARRMQRIRTRQLRAAGGRAPAPPADPPGEVRLALRPADGEATRDRALRLAVAPGGSVSLLARVHNRTGRVEHFKLSVGGLPEGWSTIETPKLELNPFGARGRHEQDVEIRLHPPRSPRSAARPWRFQVTVVSVERGVEVASATATLLVGRFDALATELRPARRASRRRARFTVAVYNGGNAPAELQLAATDEDEQCRLQLHPAKLTMAPETTGTARLTVRPRKRHWIGRPIPRAFTVTHAATGAREESQPVPGMFHHRPWLPWWLSIVVPLAAAAAVLALTLLPKHSTVPDVEGAKSPFAAQQELTKAELELVVAPEQREVEGAVPGSVVAQDPPPGTEVDRRSRVTVVVAAGSAMRKVPNIVGLTPTAADRLLQQAGLALGRVDPVPPDDAATIASQNPNAGAKAEEGTAVTATLEEGEGSGGGAPVPPNEPEQSPTATPTPGPEAAGLPPLPLAFDDGVRIALWDPETQRHEPLVTQASRRQPAIEAAWSADGSALAYRQADEDGQGRIFVLDPAAGEASARPVTKGDGDFRRPAFSPDGSLIAMVDSSGERDRLCLIPNDGRAHVPRCLRAPDWDVQRQPAWSPDGRTLLVIAEHRDDEERTGLLAFRTKAPGSASPGRWRLAGDGLAVQIANPNAIAWSSDGATIAVIAAADGFGYHLYLLDAGRRGPTGEPRSIADVPGCEVAWVSDGRVAVSQYDCSAEAAPAGPIVVVDPEDPTQLVPIPGVRGANPAPAPEAEG